MQSLQQICSDLELYFNDESRTINRLIMELAAAKEARTDTSGIRISIKNAERHKNSIAKAFNALTPVAISRGEVVYIPQEEEPKDDLISKVFQEVEEA